jgi:hypothetical protein
VMSNAAGLWKLFRDQAERDSGIGPKLFGFIAESVFTIIPESCSGSSWNGVRNHPGMAFILDRIPQIGAWRLTDGTLRGVETMVRLTVEVLQG